MRFRHLVEGLDSYGFMGVDTEGNCGENHYINDNQLSIEYYQDILAKLQGQINLVAQQMTMMEQCMEKLYGALRSPQGIQDKLVVHLEEENTLLRKELTEFQVAHMELLAHRRRCTLQKYRDAYEASHGIRKGIRRTRGIG